MENQLKLQYDILLENREKNYQENLNKLEMEMNSKAKGNSDQIKQMRFEIT